jgi:hypothetical protein
VKKPILSLFKLGIFCVTLVLALGLSHAQEKVLPLGFSDVSDKFLRNFKIVMEMTPEPEIKELLEIVAAQANDVRKFYETGGAGTYRNRLIREQDDLIYKKGISKRDSYETDKLRDDIEKRDPENRFDEASERVRQAIGNLQEALSEIVSDDAWRKELTRVTQEHLRVYLSALSKADGREAPQRKDDEKDKGDRK